MDFKLLIILLRTVSFFVSSILLRSRFKLMGLNEIDYFTDCILLKQLLCVKFTTISWHPIGQLVTTGFKRSLMKLSGFMSFAVFTYFLATRENGLNMTCLSRSSSPNSHRFLISSHVKSPAQIYRGLFIFHI